jgi:hypothetical protein
MTGAEQQLFTRHSAGHVVTASERAVAVEKVSVVSPCQPTATASPESAPLEDWIDGSALLSDIKRALAIVDPPPE